MTRRDAFKSLLAAGASLAALSMGMGSAPVAAATRKWFHGDHVRVFVNNVEIKGFGVIDYDVMIESVPGGPYEQFLRSGRLKFTVTR